MRIKKAFLNLSITLKFVLITYIIVLVISIILGIFFYSTSHKYIINKVSNSNLSIVRQINSNITSLENDMFDISNYMATNRVVSAFLKSNDNPNNTTQSDFLVKNDLKELMMNMIVTKKYLSLMALFREGMDHSPYFTSNDLSSGLRSFSEIKKNEIYDKINANNGAPYWFFIEKNNDYILQNNKNSKFILGRLIKDSNDYSTIGLLLLCANEQAIRNIYSGTLQSQDEGIAVVDHDGNIISKSGLDFYDKDTFDKTFLNKSTNDKDGFSTSRIKGKNMLVAYSSNNPAGLKIFFAVPTSTLTKEINSMKYFTVLIILVCILLSLPLILLTTSYITSPLKKLLKSMKNFQLGNFDEKVIVNYTDEIGQLGDVYNKMVSNLKELIEKNYVLQIKEREAELNALQAHINPHFLYNTLDTIFWCAQSSGQKELGKMVYSLSKLFRLSLNKGKGWTSVSREKELLEHYLLLQKMRFQEKLNYEIYIDESTLNMSIPKLILQPFVENAILHGLEGKENGGTVIIRGETHDNFLFFTIEDDGVGMDEDHIKELFEDKANSQNNILNLSGGYAVKNVAERLRIKYKDDYVLEFISQPGIGTKVKIKIPALVISEDEEVALI